MLTKVGADIVIEVAPANSSGPTQGAVLSDLQALPNGGFSALWTVRDLDPLNPSTDFKFQSFGIAGAAETTVLHSPMLLSVRGALALTSPTTVAVFSTTGAIEVREFRTVGGAPIDGPSTAVPNTAVLPAFGDVIATSGGKSLFVYRAEVGGVDQLFARAFNANNDPGAAIRIGASAADQFAPSIARLSNGNVVVGYGTTPGADTGNIGAFIVNENGARVVGPLAVNQVVAGQQNGVQVAALTSGGFVATWVDNTTSSTKDDIRARIYDNTGKAVTSDFRVNTTLPEDQNNADVVGLSGGRFAIVWESDVGQGRIIGQVFDRLGNAIGGETIIAQSAVNNWFQSAKLELLADGKLLVGMTNDKAEEGIVARTFDPGKTGTAGNDVLTGAVAGRVLEGLGGNDTLTGTTFGDVIDGGVGRDKLTGGLGKDFFVFAVAPSLANLDTITDFKVVDDTIRLENAIFRAVGAKVDATELLLNTTGLAADANDFLIYEKDTGELYYDSNGSGAGGSVLVAILPTKPLLTVADFAMI